MVALPAPKNGFLFLRQSTFLVKAQKEALDDLDMVPIRNGEGVNRDGSLGQCAPNQGGLLRGEFAGLLFQPLRGRHDVALVVIRRRYVGYVDAKRPQESGVDIGRKVRARHMPDMKVAVRGRRRSGDDDFGHNLITFGPARCSPVRGNRMDPLILSGW